MPRKKPLALRVQIMLAARHRHMTIEQFLHAAQQYTCDTLPQFDNWMKGKP